MSRSRHFWKMHGLGNDFVVFDAVNDALSLDAGQIRRLADRRRGVGCDQVLVLARASVMDADFDYRVFNADGGEVSQCGNGARCVARLAIERGHIDPGPVRLATLSGILEAMPEGDQFRVDMGYAAFEPAALPAELPADDEVHVLEVDGRTVEFRIVALGNPHAVIRVDDVETAPVAELGPALEQHPAFPQGVNVGFLEPVDSGRARLRVWERGAGETLACGSGACAALAVGHRAGWLDSRATIGLQGGELVISFDSEARRLFMTGPATYVFEGRIEP